MNDALQLADSQSTFNNQRSQYVRKKPIWMSDYKIIRIDQSADSLTYFALFSYFVHVTFKDIIK